MNTLTTEDRDLNAAPTAIRAIGFSDDGKTLYASEKSGGIWLWKAIPRDVYLHVDALLPKRANGLTQQTASVAPLFAPYDDGEVSATQSQFASVRKLFLDLPGNISCSLSLWERAGERSCTTRSKALP
jgi:hypothetical protein